MNVPQSRNTSFFTIIALFILSTFLQPLTGHAKVNTITFSSLPEKTHFLYDEPLTTDGGKLTISHTDGITQTVNLTPEMVSFFNSEKVPYENISTGISLDCARRYCSVSLIKQYIDLLSHKNGTFLTLHLMDNENVGVECEYLDQTATESNRQPDGSHLNPLTGKRFLSKEQIHEIIVYARQNNVNIIPEIDMPGHMGGLFRLARIKFGEGFIQTIAVNEAEVPGELNITEERALDFAYEILDEYMSLFFGQDIFCFGADEYWTNYGEKTIDFINDIANTLMRHRFVPRIYNDLIRKEYISRLNHDVQVIYWSHDGATNSDEVRAERQAQRASFPELQEAGFPLILTNSYYLYFVPSQRNTNEADLNYTTQDIRRNWNLSKWDDEHLGGLSTYQNIIGAEIALWQEESQGVSDETILQQIADMYNAMTDVLECDSVKERLRVSYEGFELYYDVIISSNGTASVVSSPSKERQPHIHIQHNDCYLYTPYKIRASIYHVDGTCILPAQWYEAGNTRLNIKPGKYVILR